MVRYASVQARKRKNTEKILNHFFCVPRCFRYAATSTMPNPILLLSVSAHKRFSLNGFLFLQQHRVTVAEKPVARRDGVAIGGVYGRASREGGNEHQ